VEKPRDSVGPCSGERERRDPQPSSRLEEKTPKGEAEATLGKRWCFNSRQGEEGREVSGGEGRNGPGGNSEGASEGQEGREKEEVLGIDSTTICPAVPMGLDAGGEEDEGTREGTEGPENRPKASSGSYDGRWIEAGQGSRRGAP
jgi:hypothetical protein